MYCQVYKAKLDGKFEVAVKFLNPAEAGGFRASHRRKFEEEISIMRMCQHDNVISFLGCWATEVNTQRQQAASTMCKC